MVDRAVVDTTPNCGNMLAAVVPFALEVGLVRPQGETTTMRVLTLNTDMRRATSRCRRRAAGRVGEREDRRRAGPAAPIAINFLDTAGSVCSNLTPTGNVRDRLTVEGKGSIRSRSM